MKLALCLVITSAFFANGALANKDTSVKTKVYYRYVNDQGAKVLDTAIPPRFIRNGYEEVSMQGEIIRVVPAAPDEAVAEKIQREKELQQQQHRYDSQLRHRYSNVNDIEAVKKRTLLELKSTTDILQGNLINIRGQIDNQQSVAARFERGGNEVPRETLQKIKDLHQEAKDLEDQITQRSTEYQAQSERFDAERRRFEEIAAEDS